MKSKKILLIPFLALLIVIAVLSVMDRRQKPAWEVNLDSYLTFIRQENQYSFRVISAGTASAPANFTPAMSVESYSDSLTFQVTPNEHASYSANLQPWQYPPEEVICVLLQGDNQQQVVYVALHVGLQSAEWVVHLSSAAWGSANLRSQLNSLRCSLKT